MVVWHGEKFLFPATKVYNQRLSEQNGVLFFSTPVGMGEILIEIMIEGKG